MIVLALRLTCDHNVMSQTSTELYCVLTVNCVVFLSVSQSTHLSAEAWPEPPPASPLPDCLYTSQSLYSTSVRRASRYTLLSATQDLIRHSDRIYFNTLLFTDCTYYICTILLI